MLTIIEGGFSSGAFDEIKRRIMLSRGRGRRAYLIVPEQQTVIAEAEMTDFMPPDAPLYFEVTNFTRLANSSFRTLGGIANEYCDKTKKRLVMWRAINEIAPMLLGCTGMSEIPAALADKYLSAMAEMQAAGIDADGVAELATDETVMSDSRLKGKLTDLASVMSVYKRLLGERYSDISDDIGNLIIKLDQNTEFLCDTDIFIDGFTSFTSEQERLISKLSSRTDVTVTLTIPKGRQDAFEYSEPAATRTRLTTAASSENVIVKLNKIDGRFGKKHDVLYEVVDNIWRNNAKIDNNYLQNDDTVRVFASKTPFDMCDFLAADIRRRVRDGERYSDFAVVCAGAEKYSGILDASLAKYKVPAFSSYKRSSDEFSIFKLIYSAYKAALFGFAREDVISYAKCAFLSIPAEDIDLFELYVTKWQINGRRFTDGLYWSMGPHGYDKGNDDEALLERINDVKEKIIEPLVIFGDEVRECTYVSEHAGALVKFLSTIDAEGALEKKADELLLDGENGEAQEYRRLWSTVCHALDGLVESVGDMEAGPDSFRVLLRIAFSGVEIGRIPAYADEVLIGNADMLRIYGKRHIYLIGVNEGEFPASRSADGGYFAERERSLLSSLGINLNSGEEIASARELFCFSRAMSYASESLTFMYSESTSALKPCSPSDAITRLKELFTGALAVTKTYDMPPSMLIWTPDSIQDALCGIEGAEYEALKSALSDIGEERIMDVAESSVANNGISLTPELAREFYGDEIWLSQTKIDSYIDCPLKHFCKFNLNLTDDEIYEFGARNIGTFIHAVLENFFRELKRRGGSADDIDAATREHMLTAAAEEYIASAGEGLKEGGARMKIRIARLVRAAKPIVEKLCDEVKNSKYIPTFFELRLSDKDSSLPNVPTIKADDEKRIKISGIVDRVDTMKVDKDVYVRVLDYKTGSKLFSPDDIEKGRNLQMFIYLKAIEEAKSDKFKESLGLEDGGKAVPAGVMYIGTSVKDITVKSYDEAGAINAIKSKQKCQGMLLSDDVNLDAVDKSFSPIKYTRGAMSEDSRELLYSIDEWPNIVKTVESAIVSAADKMCSGEIAPKPEKSEGRNPCEYCEFKPICRRTTYS